MVLIAVAITAGMSVGPLNMGGKLLGSGLCAGTALALFRLTERINLRASPAMGLVLTSAFAGFGFFAILAAIFVAYDLLFSASSISRYQEIFLLVCVAGVLMSRALFSLLTGSQMVDGELIFTGLSFQQFPWVLAMVLGSALLSLLLDRRSLLVGSLLPTVGIFDVGNNGEAAIMAGFALAGTALIFFSTTWMKLRTGLLALLPTRLAAQLPRTNLMAQGQRPTRRHKELWRLR